MYEFYGLREKTFNKTPDPRFLYQSSKHAKALARRKGVENIGQEIIGSVVKDPLKRL